MLLGGRPRTTYRCDFTVSSLPSESTSMGSSVASSILITCPSPPCDALEPAWKLWRWKRGVRDPRMGWRVAQFDQRELYHIVLFLSSLQHSGSLFPENVAIVLISSQRIDHDRGPALTVLMCGPCLLVREHPSFAQVVVHRGCH